MLKSKDTSTPPPTTKPTLLGRIPPSQQPAISTIALSPFVRDWVLPGDWTVTQVQGDPGLIPGDRLMFQENSGVKSMANVSDPNSAWTCSCSYDGTVTGTIGICTFSIQREVLASGTVRLTCTIGPSANYAKVSGNPNVRPGSSWTAEAGG